MKLIHNYTNKQNTIKRFHKKQLHKLLTMIVKCAFLMNLVYSKLN